MDCWNYYARRHMPHDNPRQVNISFSFIMANGIHMALKSCLGHVINVFRRSIISIIRDSTKINKQFMLYMECRERCWCMCAQYMYSKQICMYLGVASSRTNICDHISISLHTFLFIIIIFHNNNQLIAFWLLDHIIILTYLRNIQQQNLLPSPHQPPFIIRFVRLSSRESVINLLFINNNLSLSLSPIFCLLLSIRTAFVFTAHYLAVIVFCVLSTL